MFYNRTQLGMKYLDNQKLSQFIDDVYMGKATIIQTDDQDIAVELRELSDGKPLWQWFILLALFFVICEIAFIRLLK